MSKRLSQALETSWNLEGYCSQVSNELATLTGTILGELEHGLSSDAPLTRERAMTVALSACEQLLRLNHNLKFVTSGLGPAEVTDLATILLENLDWVERELKNKKFRFQVAAESPCVGALPHGIFDLLLKNLLLGFGQSLPAESSIGVQLSQTPEHFDLRFDFEPSQGSIRLEDGLSLFTARDLTQRLGGKVLGEPTDNGAKIHLQFPKQDPSSPSFETQRTSPRVTVTLPVTLQLDGQEPVETTLRVLSRRGAYLLIPLASPKPERDQNGTLWIHHLPGESIEVPRLRIASYLRNEDEPGVGVEFLRLDTRAERVLEALIRSHGKS